MRTCCGTGPHHPGFATTPSSPLETWRRTTSVSGAVFASSPPPRQTELDEARTQKLQKLLHSKNPEDIEQANKIIQSMVKKDEEKMEKLSKNTVQLQSVTSNVRLLKEMLDNYNVSESNSEKRETSFDAKRAEKIPLNQLNKQKETDILDLEVKDLTPELPSSPVLTSG